MSIDTGSNIPSPEEVDKLSVEQRAAMAAAYLGGLEVGRQPLGLFTQLARLTVVSTVELVPLRSNPDTDTTEVLLLQRPNTDAWWPNQWHVPGTVILPTDTITHDEEIDFAQSSFRPSDSYSSTISRLIKDELNDTIYVPETPHLLEARHREGIRGHESTIMFWAGVEVVTTVIPSGKFFSMTEVIENPPEAGLVVGHADLVQRATDAYERFRATNV